MGWTPLFLQMENKNVLIVGSGEVGRRRAKRFINAGANVTIIGKTDDNDLKKLGASIKSVAEIDKWIDWSDLVVVATSNPDLNEYISTVTDNKLINRADDPESGNIIVPSSFFIGDVQICIFTKGKSPLMAKQLRKKIQKVISNHEILQMELQDFTRKIIKNQVNDQKKRKEYLYQILDDKNVNDLLNDGKIEDAKLYVANYLEKKFKTVEK
ncbi:MAG: bifunctional precorrin-2 dehydrogenase/sirohydrochlorin ferrochelatase [Methanobacteriaceae archaeon]|jgi:precorrin-2 dehydrogenase/sirohydrochlorin ferrochelatase|nr:bifunctional precorrin-2 dehydrogenase/sirohydrochlorin ferrochelatase [Methanobacteriaceae archaeon]